MPCTFALHRAAEDEVVLSEDTALGYARQMLQVNSTSPRLQGHFTWLWSQAAQACHYAGFGP